MGKIRRAKDIYCGIHFSHEYALLEIVGEDAHEILADPSKAADVWMEAWATDAVKMEDGEWVDLSDLGINVKVRIVEELTENPYEVICHGEDDVVTIWKGEK